VLSSGTSPGVVSVWWSPAYIMVPVRIVLPGGAKGLEPLTPHLQIAFSTCGRGADLASGPSVG